MEESDGRAWFFSTFGFEENDSDVFEHTQATLASSMARHGDGSWSINAIPIGPFEVLQKSHMVERFKSAPGPNNALSPGRVSLSLMTGDWASLIRSPASSGSVFLAFSAPNALPAYPYGISVPRYPLSTAMTETSVAGTLARCTPAATAWRQYLLPLPHGSIGQTPVRPSLPPANRSANNPQLPTAAETLDLANDLVSATAAVASLAGGGVADSPIAISNGAVTLTGYYASAVYNALADSVGAEGLVGAAAAGASGANNASQRVAGSLSVGVNWDAGVCDASGAASQHCVHVMNAPLAKYLSGAVRASDDEVDDPFTLTILSAAFELAMLATAWRNAYAVSTGRATGNCYVPIAPRLRITDQPIPATIVMAALRRAVTASENLGVRVNVIAVATPRDEFVRDKFER